MSLININAKLEDVGINLDSVDVGLRTAFIMAVGNVAKDAQNEWIKLAQNRLITGKASYIDGLQKSDSFSTRIIGGTTIFEIQLIGRMPNNFEFGMDAFDMKAVRPGWLGGSKAKTSSDGTKYITIPFRHSLTSAASIQYSGQAKRENLRGHLKDTIRRFGLDKMVRAATGQVVSGSVKRVPKRPDVHRFLHGLTRIQTPNVGRTPSGLGRGSSQLMTFRRMSEKSPPGSWQHPGINAVNLMEEVERWIDGELDRITEIMFGAR